MFAIATAIAVLAGLAGLYLSYYAGTAGGASVALAIVAAYLLALAGWCAAPPAAPGRGYDRLMPAKAADSAWAEHAFETLQERRPAPRRRPHRGGRGPRPPRLRGHRARARRRAAPRGGSRVGRASVYRALEQLEQLGLVQRLEVSRGTAGYERVEPGGHHHHHAICRRCGRMVPFEDPALERAIDRLSKAGRASRSPTTTSSCAASVSAARAELRTRGRLDPMGKTLYTAEAHVTGGRVAGHGRTSDGALEVDLRSPPELGGEEPGTNPEQLFAVGYASCFESALAAVARRRKLEAGDVGIDSKVMLVTGEERSFTIAVELAVTCPGRRARRRSSWSGPPTRSVLTQTRPEGNIEVALSANGVPVTA